MIQGVVVCLLLVIVVAGAALVGSVVAVDRRWRHLHDAYVAGDVARVIDEAPPLLDGLASLERWSRRFGLRRRADLEASPTGRVGVAVELLVGASHHWLGDDDQAPRHLATAYALPHRPDVDGLFDEVRPVWWTVLAAVEPERVLAEARAMGVDPQEVGGHPADLYLSLAAAMRASGDGEGADDLLGRVADALRPAQARIDPSSLVLRWHALAATGWAAEILADAPLLDAVAAQVPPDTAAGLALVLGTAQLMAIGPRDAAQTLERAAAGLAATGQRQRWAHATVLRVHALLTCGQLDDADAALAQLSDPRGVPPELAPHTAMLRAALRWARGERRAAAADLDGLRARQELVRSDLLSAGLLVGRIELEDGHPDEARREARDLLALAGSEPQLAERRLRAAAHRLLAVALARSGEATGRVEAELAVGAGLVDEPLHRIEQDAAAAEAHRWTGQPERAVAAGERAVAAADELGCPVLAATAAQALAHAAVAAGRPATARHAAERARRDFERFGMPLELADVVDLLDSLDRPGA